MEFIRPEIRFAAWRYRDALIGGIVSIFGIGWAQSSVGFMSMLGYAVTVAGALLIFAGIQRGRFRTHGGGTGMVSVDEGQVTYFGPDEGGTVHVDDLIQVDLAPPDPDEDEKHASWLLLSDAPEPLRIPVDAVGTDALFDVFAKLKGIHTGRMLDWLAKRPPQQVVIWRTGQPASD